MYLYVRRCEVVNNDKAWVSNMRYTTTKIKKKKYRESEKEESGIEGAFVLSSQALRGGEELDHSVFFLSVYVRMSDSNEQRTLLVRAHVQLCPCFLKSRHAENIQHTRSRQLFHVPPPLLCLSYSSCAPKLLPFYTSRRPCLLLLLFPLLYYKRRRKEKKRSLCCVLSLTV